MGKNKVWYILTVLLLILAVSEFVIIILQRNQLKEQKEIAQAEYSDIMIKDLRYGDSFDMIKVADTEENEATLKYGAGRYSGK